MGISPKAKGMVRRERVTQNIRKLLKNQELVRLAESRNKRLGFDAGKTKC
jgi:hypothetical protein